MIRHTHTRSVVAFSSPPWGQTFSSSSVCGQGPKPLSRYLNLVAVNRHILIRAGCQLEASKLACRREPFDVPLDQSLVSTVTLLVCAGCYHLLVHAQAPDVEGIIIWQSGDTRRKVFVVGGRGFTIQNPIVRLAIGCFDLRQRLSSKVNVSATSRAV